MKIKKALILGSFIALVFFSGCSEKVEEYNKPAVYWYGKIIESAASGNLEKADNYYSSLQSEHTASPLLPEATMILAIAHMHYEEYLLSEHFLSEYMKRYANRNEKEFSEFMKIKAKYTSLPNPRRDQVLIDDALKSANEFKFTYPNSMYYDVVDTIATNLYMAQAVLNETIAGLYDRVDKPKASMYYRNIEKQPWIDWKEVNKANVSWYKEWFEGDGTSAWYDFMIPDTINVVSKRNYQKISDTNTTKKEDKI